MNTRIIIFTGKGGVGKTMISTAHAVASAEQGARTLLVSADMAHNLGDILEQDIGSTVCHVRENLDALEMDPDKIMQEDFPDFMRAWKNVLNGASIPPDEQDDFTTIPGFESLFSMMKIVQMSETGEYDRIIVDCAPTGETLSMLKLPELLSWYFERFFPVGRVAFRMLNPITKTFMKIQLPDKNAMNDTEKVFLELIKVQESLKDGSKCTVRLVTTPEKMVVEETKRSFMYLNLYQYTVDGIYINRIIPKLEDNPFFLKWYDIQKNYIAELEQVFAGIPIEKYRWYPSEIRGMEAVEQFCSENFKGKDMDEIFSVRSHRENEVYTAKDGTYVLTIDIPFADKDDIEVIMHDTDLTIRAGTQTRLIPLPYTLKGAKIGKTEYKDGKFDITFVPGEGGFRI